MTYSVAILYPNKDDIVFDKEYYLNKHIPLLEQSWGTSGLLRWEVVEYGLGPDGLKPVYAYGWSDLLRPVVELSKPAYLAEQEKSVARNQIGRSYHVNPLDSSCGDVSAIPFGGQPKPEGHHMVFCSDGNGYVRPREAYAIERSHIYTDSDRLVPHNCPNCLDTTKTSSPSRDLPFDGNHSREPTSHCLQQEGQPLYLNIELPSFIVPLPERMQKDDVAYLSSKRALILPSVQFRNAALRSYFENVHPFMPVIDVDHFLRIVALEGGGDKVSLLLYQGVMFAGAAYVPMDIIRGAGFKNRKDARKELFQRAKLLYDFNYESDRPALVQTLLIFALWYDFADDHRNGSHWIDVAVRQTFASGLHNEPDESFSTQERSLRRRIWWSCYVIDRMASLDMKRFPQIRSHDYQVSVLEDSDFDGSLDPVPPEVQYLYVQDKVVQRSLDKSFVQLVALCQILDPFFMLCGCQAGGADEGTSDHPQSSSSSNVGRSPPQLILTFKHNMEAWKRSLPQCCVYQPPSTINANLTLMVYQTSLHMLFLSLMLTVYNCELAQAQHLGGSSYMVEEVRTRLLSVTFQISDMASEAHETGLDRFFPIVVLLIVAPAAAVILRERENVDAEDWSMFNQGLTRCIEVMDTMQSVFESIRVARDAINWAASHISTYPVSATDTATRCADCSYDGVPGWLSGMYNSKPVVVTHSTPHKYSTFQTQSDSTLQDAYEEPSLWLYGAKEFFMFHEARGKATDPPTSASPIFMMEGLGIFDELSSLNYLL
ncbi:hypothetical protein NM208_g2200 [Fusarium decemcellulare]|uniref:Uncharacterized protein n=1 Tax=Fusarium decemcellulare TaxID=57161 RepID=A0ACC1STF8_9HYPO|nr:hypothetical protein NM208_g2200 [Fusarium decemcellulare]